MSFGKMSKILCICCTGSVGILGSACAEMQNVLQLGKDAFYAFENDSWEMDFFDGMK